MSFPWNELAHIASSTSRMLMIVHELIQYLVTMNVSLTHAEDQVDGGLRIGIRVQDLNIVVQTGITV
jgi:hypothetical protein